MGQNTSTSARKQQKRVILICGMHRSGTSLMAHLFMDLGLSFGTRLLEESVPDNIEGYGEYADVVALEEALLDQLDRTWYDANGAIALPADWLSWPETVATEQRLQRIVADELENANVWAVKDPRASRLLPMWIKVLGEMDVDLAVIVCTRHPDGVVQSLERRNKMPFEFAYEIFSRHYSDIIRAMSNNPAPVYAVDYDDVVEYPEENIKGIVEHLALSVDADAIAHAARRIKNDLRHHATFDIVETAPRAYALKLYRRVRALDFVTGTQELKQSTVEDCSVSIIMRTKDRLQFVPRALRSVLGQTHGNWHIVLVNDGGDSAGLSVVVEPYLAALRGRLTQIDLITSRGMEAASNCGIRAREDQFIVIHDDDDSWAPEFLDACLRRLVVTGANGVVTRTTIIEEFTDKNVIKEINRKEFRPEITSITIKELFRGNMFPPISYLFRRNIFNEIGPFQEDLPVLGDWEYNVRAAQHSTIEFLDRPLAYWHWRPSLDRHPNSDNALHLKFDGVVRDRWLRNAGPVSLALGTATNTVLRSVESVRTELVNATEMVARRVEQHITRISVQNASMVASLRQARQSGDADHSSGTSAELTPLSLVLSPNYRFEVIGEAPNGEQQCVGNDPQLHYNPPEPLPRGRYWAECTLELRSGSGPVELFYSPTALHEPDRNIVLQPLGNAVYGGVFDCVDAVQYLRVDPMTSPGGFCGGMLAIRRMPASTNRLPDFLCIGAQYAGSEWLRETLRTQSSYYIPPCMEVHALDDMAGIDRDRWTKERLEFLDHAKLAVVRDQWNRNAQSWQHLRWASRFAISDEFDYQWYQSLFIDADEHQVIGDITPSYANLPERAVAQVAAAMPNAHVFFLLRDPIDEAILFSYCPSHTTSLSESIDVIASLNASGIEINITNYREQITMWERYFPESSIHVFMFDDFIASPTSILSSMCKYLGVATGNKPPPLFPLDQVRIPDVELPSETVRTLALQCRDDLQWLANRFEGCARDWLNRAEKIISGYII